MSKTPADTLHCRATRSNGQPCRGKPLTDGLCFAHSQASQEWRKMGGHSRSNTARAQKALPLRLRPIADTLCDALAEVHAGKLTPAQGTAIAALASALVRCVTAGEFEQRIRHLEQVAGGA